MLEHKLSQTCRSWLERDATTDFKKVSLQTVHNSHKARVKLTCAHKHNIIRLSSTIH